MKSESRRRFLIQGCQAGALAAFPAGIRRALGISAAAQSGTLKDVQHVVILMQENRSFDHYFGSLRGVRGFGDRHIVPLAGGKPVWYQSDGTREITPYRLDSRTTSALRVPDTPHTFADAQAAWNQGRFGFWPKFKTRYSMGYYQREDIPFQYALAEAFTLCDAHHCSVTTGTDPNRIVLFSGSNFDPRVARRGQPCSDRQAEVNNLRCLVKGTMPDPGYRYQGEALTWKTIPEILEQAGISWRIYQDPNDNWTGLMHGGLAFAGFRDAKAGGAIYENGMRHWSLDDLARDVDGARLPQVSWLLPPMRWSEHPSPSSPLEGGEFTSRVLDALTSNSEVWSKTVLFLSFDENDGQFDHVPPPAPPSYRPNGLHAGASTVDIRGEYFSDSEGKYLSPEDAANGTLRPWGLGPRVPLYVISPWSRGGWVNSQVFDHTSIGQFLEKRFNISIEAISPWHRAVCGDLTSALDFKTPNSDPMPALPSQRNSTAVIVQISERPRPEPPDVPRAPSQEPGLRRSRALPYELHVEDALRARSGMMELHFRNLGAAGAVFQVYDRLQLDSIPNRFTVESGHTISHRWDHRGNDWRYDLWVLGPNGFLREFRGRSAPFETIPTIRLSYRPAEQEVVLRMANEDAARPTLFEVSANAYRADGPWRIRVGPKDRVTRTWSLSASSNWYDLTVRVGTLERRFAGRMETGRDSYSDPAV